MRPATRLRHDDGFTLMEIVVALAILGLSLTVTMQLISGAFTNIARVNQYFVASNHAENIMNELLVNPEVKGAMQNSGVFDDGYQWSASVAERVVPPDPVPVAQAFPLVLLEIHVDVHWQQRQRPHTYSLKSMRVVNPNDLSNVGLSTPRLPSSGQPGQPGGFLSEPAAGPRLGPQRSRGGQQGLGGQGQQGLFPRRNP